jgi:hypothetical protein
MPLMLPVEPGDPRGLACRGGAIAYGIGGIGGICPPDALVGDSGAADGAAAHPLLLLLPRGCGVTARRGASGASTTGGGGGGATRRTGGGGGASATV